MLWGLESYAYGTQMVSYESFQKVFDHIIEILICYRTQKTSPKVHKRFKFNNNIDKQVKKHRIYSLKESYTTCILFKQITASTVLRFYCPSEQKL